VQAASVPKGASLPNPGDKLVLDGAGVSNVGTSGILGPFDLLALASPEAQQGIDKHSEISNFTGTQVASDLPSQTGPVRPDDTKAAFPKDGVPAPASPQAVDALVAMDKTARNGLAARKASPPIERDWTLAITVPSEPLSPSEAPLPWPSLTLNLGQALAPSPSPSLPSADMAMTADPATDSAVTAEATTAETVPATGNVVKLGGAARDLIAQSGPTGVETAVATPLSSPSLVDVSLDQPKQANTTIQENTDTHSNASVRSHAEIQSHTDVQPKPETQSNAIIPLDDTLSSDNVTTRSDDPSSRDLQPVTSGKPLDRAQRDRIGSNGGLIAQPELQTRETLPNTLDHATPTPTPRIVASEPSRKQTEAQAGTEREPASTTPETSKPELSPAPVVDVQANVIPMAPVQEIAPVAPIQNGTPANTNPAPQYTGTLLQSDIRDPASPPMLEANETTAPIAGQDQPQTVSAALKTPITAKQSRDAIRMTVAPIIDGSRAGQSAATNNAKSDAASNPDSSDLQTLNQDLNSATVLPQQPQSALVPTVVKAESVIATPVASPQTPDNQDGTVVDRSPQVIRARHDDQTHHQDRKHISATSGLTEAQPLEASNPSMPIMQPAAVMQAMPHSDNEPSETSSQEFADSASDQTTVSNSGARGKKRFAFDSVTPQEKRQLATSAPVKVTPQPASTPKAEESVEEATQHTSLNNAAPVAKPETQNNAADTAMTPDPIAADASESLQDNNVASPANQALAASTIANPLNGQADDKPHAEDLPPSVTIESVTLRSGGREHDTDASAPLPRVDQSGQDARIPAAVGQADAHPSYTLDSGYHSALSTSQLDYSQTPSVPQSTLTRVDNPAFVAQRQRAFEQQIMSALRNGGSEVRAMLYPPQLGQVTINLLLDGNKVRVSAKTSSRDATHVLLSEKPSLTSALDDEGFVLTGFDVHDDSSNNSSSHDQSSPSAFEPVHTLKPSTSRTDASFSLDITI
jgi:Flagellar hook-length control protein FliK